MTHGAIPKAEQLKRGIKDNLVRLSIGIEPINDLQEDLNSRWPDANEIMSKL
jgi:cystathionine gamma-synthase/cystathionine gamma-lyase